MTGDISSDIFGFSLREGQFVHQVEIANLTTGDVQWLTTATGTFSANSLSPSLHVSVASGSLSYLVVYGELPSVMNGNFSLISYVSGPSRGTIVFDGVSPVGYGGSVFWSRNIRLYRGKAPGVRYSLTNIRIEGFDRGSVRVENR